MKNWFMKNSDITEEKKNPMEKLAKAVNRNLADEEI